MIPSDRTIVARAIPRRDRRLAALRPVAVRRPGARRLGARGVRTPARAARGLEADALWSDDGLVLRLPELDADDERALPSAAELLMLEPEELDGLIAARARGLGAFRCTLSRERRARAADPARLPGPAHAAVAAATEGQNLLEVARRYPDFPIVLETMRECLRDVLDVAGLRELLAAMHRREIGSSRSRASTLRRSPHRCSSTTSRLTCTRTTFPPPSAVPRR